jgi:hypothetical protein
MTTLLSSIDLFSQQICNRKPSLVPHRPEEWAKHTCCIENVLDKVERDGGGGDFGWYFMPRCSADYGNYLVATHHAIWISSDRKAIDITPFHPDQHHWPVSQNDSILFLLDSMALPFRSGKGHCAPLASKYFPMDDRANLRSYLDDLSVKEQQECQRIYADLEARN